MKDKNRNNIDDDFEKKLFRDLAIIQIGGVITFIIIVVICAYLIQGH